MRRRGKGNGKGQGKGSVRQPVSSFSFSFSFSFSSGQVRRPDVAGRLVVAALVLGRDEALPLARAQGLGWATPEQWTTFRDSLLAYGGLTTTVPVEQVFTEAWEDVRDAFDSVFAKRYGRTLAEFEEKLADELKSR